MSTGQPQNKPNAPTYITDPYASGISTYDQGPLRQAMQQAIAKNAAGSREQALSSLGRAGVNGADTGRAMNDVASTEANQENQLEAQLSQQDYQNRMSQMSYLNSLAANQYNSQLTSYYSDLNAYLAERQSRANSLQSGLSAGMSTGGSMLGQYLGSKSGGDS